MILDHFYRKMDIWTFEDLDSLLSKSHDISGHFATRENAHFDLFWTQFEPPEGLGVLKDQIFRPYEHAFGPLSRTLQPKFCSLYSIWFCLRTSKTKWSKFWPNLGSHRVPEGPLPWARSMGPNRVTFGPSWGPRAFSKADISKAFGLEGCSEPSSKCLGPQIFGHFDPFDPFWVQKQGPESKKGRYIVNFGQGNPQRSKCPFS